MLGRLCLQKEDAVHAVVARNNLRRKDMRDVDAVALIAEFDRDTLGAKWLVKQIFAVVWRRDESIK